MVLVNFDTGTPLVPGDQEYDDSKPTEEHVLEIFSVYKSHFEQFHSQCSEEDDYYFGDKTVPIPDEMPIDPVRPATPHAIVNVATDHVDVNNPAIFVPAPSPRAKNRSERIQKFLQGVWMHIPEHTKRTIVKHSIQYGVSFMKAWWDGDKWPDTPMIDNYESEEEYKEALREHLDRRDIAFPFVLDAVNPKNLLWDDSRACMKWTIEFYESDSHDIQALYPEWQPVIPSSETVTFLEYWDDTWCGRMADGEWVWGPYKHGYGFNPYIKVQPASSMDYDVGAPDMRYQGILKPVHSLLDSEARLITQYEAILRQYAWRTIDFYGPASSAESTMDEYELFASKNWVRPNVEIRPSPLALPPQEILQQLGMVQTMIEEATFPNVVRGMRPSGVSTGFALSVLAGTGRLVFGKFADAMARGMEQANQRFLKLVNNKASGRVTVHARSTVHNFDQSIAPEDIKEFYENTVNLKAEAPEEREREALLALRLWNGGNGLISLYEAQRRVGITNPLEEQNQMAAEKLLEMARPQQAEEVAQAIQLGQQRAMAADTDLGGGGGGLGTQYLPNQAQLQRPGEGNIQQQRIATGAGRESVFPQGMGGLDTLGAQLGTATGGGRRMPSGQRVG
jgi:hypothetical protein